MKSQRIYWYLPHKTLKHDAIINRLARRNIQVECYFDQESLRKAFDRRRVASVLIEAGGSTTEFIQELKDIVYHPLFYGVRFLLTFQEAKHELVRFVTKLGFRDAISMDLPPDAWMERFSFALSAGPSKIKQPLPQMSLENIAAVSVPARITYIDHKYLRLESKIKLAPDAKIRLSGKFAHELGVQSLSLRMARRYESNLHFRFSEAYLMEWSLPEAHVAKIQVLFRTLERQAIEDPVRIFAATQNQQIRKTLLSTLRYPEFELAIALQKRSLLQEPRFFAPDIVILESKILQVFGNNVLQEMLTIIDPATPVYILGERPGVGAAEELNRNFPDRFIFIPELPSNLVGYFHRKALQNPDREDLGSGYHIPKNHRFSYAELRFPARLTKIHPMAGQLVTPFELGKFGLCTVESPMIKQVLGRGIAVKVTESYHNTAEHLSSFPEAFDCIFCDVNPGEHRRLADHIANSFRDHLQENLDQISPEKKKSAVKELPPKTLKDISDSESMQDELSLPSIEIQRKESIYKDYYESFWVKYKTEVQAVIAVGIIISLLFFLVIQLRQPESEQGKVFSDSLQKYYEKMNPGKYQNDEEN